MAIGLIRHLMSDVHCANQILRTPFATLLHWASVAFVCVTLTQAPVDSSISLAVEEHRSGTFNSSAHSEPICWEAKSPHEVDCFHDEPLTADPYPLTLEMLERASSRYTTTDFGLHRAFQRARRRGNLKVVAVGGSVTAGHDCVSPMGLANRECAWPHRLQQWCDERIEDFTCEVTNAGVPGNTIQDLLRSNLRSRLPVDLEVDLVVVDFGVNDAVLDQFHMDPNNVKLAHEVFIRYVRNEMIDMPALLYAESFISPARLRDAPLQASNMAEIHSAVTRKYDIPMASFRDAVWPDQANSSLADRIWGASVHPDWQVQQLLADVIAYFIEKSYARFLEEHGLLSDPTRHEKALTLYETQMGCMAYKPSFEMRTGRFVGLPPPEQQVESVMWAFSKDARGGGGLIGFGNSSANATVTFDLPCSGEKNLLDIGFLKSYTGMGAVRVVVKGFDSDADVESDKHSGDVVAVVVDGLWESQASMTEHVVISTQKGSDIIRVTFVVLSAYAETVYANFLPDVTTDESDMKRQDRKFKITSIECC